MKKYTIENQLVLARKFIEEDLARGVGYYDIVFQNKPELMTEEDFIDLALAYEDLDNVPKGIEVYHGLINSFPQSDRGHYGLGVFYEEIKEIEKSVEHYLNAIKLNDEFFEAYFYLAGVYDDQEETVLAIENYEKALALNPYHYYTNLNLGSIYEGLGEDEKALAFFEKALKIEYHYLALFNLGVIAMKHHNHKKAIEYYNECLILNPNYGYAYLNLSLIYKQTFQYDKAIEVLSSGISATEEESYLYYHRACNYALINDKEGCIKDLQVALNLYPGFNRYIQEDEDLVDLKEELQLRLVGV